MDNDSHDPMDLHLASAFEARVPEEVRHRLGAQLAEFRKKLLARQPNLPSSWWFDNRRRIFAGAAAAAAVIMIIGASVLLRPQLSFAEVVAAVERLSWVHAVIEDADGDTREIWYSKDDISASRSDDWIEFHDHKLRSYDSFDVKEGILYRVPEYTPRRHGKFAMMAESLRLLLQDGKVADDPLAGLEFLDKTGSELTLIDQSLDRTRVDAREWLDYRLTVRYSTIADPVHFLFRVDPTTMLPAMCRVEGIWEGKPVVSEQRFDYPERGPASVYDIGAPRTAKLVDRVPPDDIERILETIRAGRERMDDYRAIVVSRMNDPNYMWWYNERPMIMYRKGSKFRVEDARWTGNYPSVSEPAEDVDLESWWRKRARDFVFCPFYIVNDSTQYRIEIQPTQRADGIEQLEVKSVEEHEIDMRPGEMYPPYWSRRPEFVCRPPLGIPSQELEPILVTSPADGPAGSILLRVTRSGRMPRAHDPDASKFPPRPDAYRFWLDSKRGYAVVRHDMMGTDDAGNESVTHGTIVDELAESPRGVWFAKRFRVEAVPPVEHDQIFDVYIDFDADLPESLFEPPVVGQVFAKDEK